MANEDILWDYPLSNTVFGRVLEATQRRIKALNLKCIPKDNIQIRKLAWAAAENDIKPPYLFISPRPEITDWTKGTNERDMPVYAVMLSAVLANSRDVTTKGMGLQFEWRQMLRRSFTNISQGAWPDLSLADPMMAGVSYNGCYVEAGESFLEDAKRLQYDAQYWLVRFRFLEPRG